MGDDDWAGYCLSLTSSLNDSVSSSDTTGFSRVDAGDNLPGSFYALIHPSPEWLD